MECPARPTNHNYAFCSRGVNYFRSVLGVSTDLICFSSRFHSPRHRRGPKTIQNSPPGWPLKCCFSFTLLIQKLRNSEFADGVPSKANKSQLCFLFRGGQLFQAHIGCIIGFHVESKKQIPKRNHAAPNPIKTAVDTHIVYS